jgi:hypothetical protein
VLPAAIQVLQLCQQQQQQQQQRVLQELWQVLMCHLRLLQLH